MKAEEVAKLEEQELKKEKQLEKKKLKQLEKEKRMKERKEKRNNKKLEQKKRENSGNDSNRRQNRDIPVHNVSGDLLCVVLWVNGHG